MTYSEVLSTIRQTIKEVTDDTKYTDSYLYSLWKLGRARFLSQLLKRKDYINRGSYISVCLELETGLSHDCSCVPSGCQVLYTKHQIAPSLSSRFNEGLQVLTLDGTLIPHRHANEIKSDMLDPIKKGRIGYTIVNQKILIWNTLELKAIQIRQITGDPLYYQSIQYCPDTSDCIDIYSLDTGLDEAVEDLVLDSVLQRLQLPIKIKDDDSADANPEIR